MKNKFIKPLFTYGFKYTILLIKHRNNQNTLLEYEKGFNVNNPKHAKVCTIKKFYVEIEDRQKEICL